MKLTDDAGTLLDAEFDVEPAIGGFEVVFHARYGGRFSDRQANVDYFPALEVLLARLASLHGVLDSIAVDSKVARRLPLSDRLLDLTYPIEISAATDIVALRRAITRAQRGVARDANAKTDGGNNHKRIRLRIRLPVEIPVAQFVEVLEGVESTGRAELGTRYRPAEPEPSVATSEVFTIDPAKLERALAAHADTQNSLADHLRTLGFVPRSPGSGDPDFDLAWVDGEVVVAEVKSLTGANEDRQLRLGLGQVLHYRHLLSNRFGSARAVLAVEQEPAAVWKDICIENGVTLTWPPTWEDVA